MTPPPATGRHAALRHRDGHHARVTYEELFFDLVYVFAITQLSHQLVHHLSPAGLLETLILWFAVWLGWQYTSWVTNWFDPESPRIRGLVFCVMLLGLVMACSIPQAFGERGLIFAGCYVALQVGRTAFIVWELGAGHPLRPNFVRMLVWLLVAGVFWIAGGLAHHEWRIALWLLAAACEYLSPMFGFAVPGLGRSRTDDWTIEGGHLAERCQLFVIVALGETLLASGITLAGTEAWDAALVSALLASFLGTLALWWLYFGTSVKDASAAILGSDDPGRMGAYFHYVHAILVAGIIGTAVGNDLVLAHPHDPLSTTHVLVMVGGPVLYLLGSAVYKKVVYGAVPRSHIAGALALAALVPVAHGSPLMLTGWLTTGVLLAVGFWEGRRARRRPRRGAHAHHAHHAH